jgi:hypothetical protein
LSIAHHSVHACTQGRFSARGIDFALGWLRAPARKKRSPVSRILTLRRVLLRSSSGERTTQAIARRPQTWRGPVSVPASRRNVPVPVSCTTILQHCCFHSGDIRRLDLLAPAHSVAQPLTSRSEEIHIGKAGSRELRRYVHLQRGPPSPPLLAPAQLPPALLVWPSGQIHNIA